jgi:hypothetical protein
LRIRQIGLIAIFLISLLQLNPAAVKTVNAAAGWTAYNDCSGSNSISNTTNYLGTNGSGELKDHSTGTGTGVTATFSTSKSLTNSSTSGAEANSATDAYSTFHNFANMVGVVQYNTSSTGDWYQDLTLTGLDPNRLYTFAATANRDGTSSTSGPSYTSRVTRFTLSGDEGAVNASTSGVTVTSEHTVAFSTGYNTANGYVARWTDIQPGADGTIVIRAQPNDASVYQVYGISVFMLQEQAPTTPYIEVSGELSSFASEIGGVSAEKTYAVSGANLTEAISIQAPDGFEISTTSGANFASQLSLSPTDGAVDQTTIYVRFNGAEAGTRSGVIAHTSAGAEEVDISVTGTAKSGWTAYNDCAGSNSITNTTNILGLTGSGELKDSLTGGGTGVTATFSTSKTLYQNTSNGAVSNAGTDAYTTFNGFANMSGLIQYPTSGTGDWYQDLTLTGLNPDRTYTFATTSNRDDSSYTSRFTRYTLSGDEGAVNASTSGVTVINDHSVAFVTGYNTENGYVARWTNIQPGADGTIVVRAQPNTASVYQAYGISVFMLEEESSQSTPSISISGSLQPFASEPGLYSDVQSYSVSGSNLTGDILISAPADFEVSASPADGFSSSLTLPETDGLVPAATVYVRFLRADVGTSSGVITHSSQDAANKSLSVSGTAASGGWVSYNDCVYLDGQISTNISKVSCFTDAASGVLVDYTSGQETGVSVLVTTSGSVAEQTSTDLAGSEPNSGTDAYNLFHDYVNMVGGEKLSSAESWIELAFTNLDPADRYTFATTANRNGADYTARETLFTISGADSVTNTSSTGVTINSDTSVAFSIGYNTVNGYVARWENIDPGTDGAFTIRYAVKTNEDDAAYGPAVFLLRQEESDTARISVSSAMTAFSSLPGTISAVQSYQVAGASLTDPIVITAPTDFEISLSSDSGFGTQLTLNPVDGEVAATTVFVRFSRSTEGASTGNLLHTSTGAAARNIAVSGTAAYLPNQAPSQPVLIGPADGATDISRPPTLEVQVSDPDADAMSVGFYGRPASGADAEDFTLVAYPDIQNESQYNPAMLNAQSNWVVAHQEDLNIVFATSLGDLVNTASSTAQYEAADAGFDILDAAGIPYSVGPGNHDQLTGDLYPTYFGTSRFTGKSWYKGAYDTKNYNNYSFFSASGMDFILINLQYLPGTNELAWADNLLKTNSDRRGIIVSHAILNTDNSYVSGAQTIYDSLKDNPNLFLMVCGHMHAANDGAAYRAELGDDGHTIYVIMADYQDMSNGNGYLRLFRFSPANDKIYMTTYSPYTDGSITSSPDQMDLGYEMDGTVSLYQHLGTNENIVSGDNTGIQWTELDAEASYQWYTTVSDGEDTTTSPVWSFTTDNGTATNHAPEITEGASISRSMSEDGSPTAFALTLNASDVDAGTTLTWSIATPASNGTASVSGTGTTKTIGYVPNANYNGSDQFVVRVSDGSLTDTITVNVSIDPVNDAPVIAEGASISRSMSEDGSPTAFALTLNASDVDAGTTLTWSIATPAANGTASVSGTGTTKTIGYVPNADYNGSDSFVVQVSDGSLTDTITVNVTIDPVNDAPVIAEGATISRSMSEDSSPTAFALTLNASDVDASTTLTWSIATPASNGTASVSGTGISKAVGYVPNADHNGSDQFVVRVSDGSLADTITVNVTIDPVNDAPVCTAVELTTVLNTAADVAPDCVDADGDSLSYAIAALPLHGTATVVSNLLHYVPASAYTGSDSFSYKASDGIAESNSATVAVTVNSVNYAPEITEGAAAQWVVSEDVPDTLTLHATDANAEDTLTWSILTQAVHGTASVSGSGSPKSVSYTSSANYFGSDSFAVQVTDGQLTDNITVNVTVNPVNDAPVIAEGASISRSMSEDSSPTAFALTLNASDVDTDTTLTWSIATPAANGTASVSGTGTSKAIGYIPNANFNGSDSFVVQVSDGSLTDTITVNVTIDSINDAPVIAEGASISRSMSEDASPTAFALTLNASDVDASTTLTWSIATPASNGTASVSGTGISKAVGYVPNADYNGNDSFVVQVSDGSLTDTITVNVAIDPVNDAPVCTPLSLSVSLNHSGEIAPACTDVDGDALTYAVVTAATNGTATLVSNKLHYEPLHGYTGQDSFTYLAADDSIESEAALVSVTVNQVNYAPVVTEGAATTLAVTEDTLATLDLHATDENEDDTLTWSIITQAGHGTAQVSGTGTSQTVSYTPAANYSGSDSFIVQVSDGGLTDSITVQVTVTAVNDAPVIQEGEQIEVVMSEDSAPLPFALTLHVSDVDSSSFTWSIPTRPLHGNVSATASGSTKVIEYTPVLNYNGTDQFIVQVTDGTLSDSITVNVTIQSVNDNPVITQGTAISVNMSEDGAPSAFSLTLDATDVDSATVLTWSILTQATHGLASVSGEGTAKAISYVPNTDYNGTDSFTVKVTDESGGADSIVVNVTIAAVNDAPVIQEGPSVTVEMSEDNSPQAFALVLHATDADSGDILTWSIAAQALHGAAGASGSGASKAITYQPQENYNGTDQFQVQVSDGKANTVILVTVDIAAVDDIPEFTEGSSVSPTIDEDQPFSMSLHVDNVDPGTNLTWDVAQEPQHGTVTFEEEPEPQFSLMSVSGTATSRIVNYEPEENYSGNDQFTISVSYAGYTGNFEINLTIQSTNDAPVCSNMNLSVVRNTPYDQTFACTDAENDPLTFTIVSIASHGNASVVDDAAHYVPLTGYIGADQFTFKASDGVQDSNIATANITVTSDNVAPQITEGSSVTVTMSEDQLPTAFELDLHASDANAEDTLTWSLASLPAHGTAAATGTGSSLSVSYTPNANYHGADSFVVQVADGFGGVDNITVDVTIEAVNDAPVMTPVGNKTVQQGKTISFSVIAQDVDLPGDGLTFSLIGAPDGASINSASGLFTWTTAPDQTAGLYQFTVRVSDSGSPQLTDEIEVQIEVTDFYAIFLPFVIAP